MASGAVNLKSAGVIGFGNLAQPFWLRCGALNRLYKDDRVLQCQVRKLLEESLSDLIVEVASAETVANVFELDGTELPVGN